MKGILFTQDNIKLTRDKIKTQTRRLFTYLPIEDVVIRPYKDGDWTVCSTSDSLVTLYMTRPRYQVGDIVYIKEGWCIGNCNKHKNYANIIYKQAIEPYFHKVSWNDWLDKEVKRSRFFNRWRSPLFMPAWAARYFIKILDLRPERLQEISRDDVIAEGVPFQDYKQDYKWAFAKLWDSINKQYPFDSNPWTWVYSFELLGDKQ